MDIYDRKEDEIMDEMKEVVRCPQCGREEYYGMIPWHNGKQMCRRCIYDVWEKESNHVWTPGKDDYIFPKYSNGVDYTNEKQEEDGK